MYGLLLILLSPFHKKARQLHQGRKRQAQNLQSLFSHWNASKRIWIHAASYGEYEMARPLVRKLLDQGQSQILVTFHSPSGYLQAELEHHNMIKSYLPLDTYRKQKAFVQTVKPTKVVFIKYEFWFNLLRVLSEEQIDFYYTSLHLNDDSYLFWGPNRPFLELINNSKHIYCHNHQSQATLAKHGIDDTSVFGDTRMEQVSLNKVVWRKRVEWTPSHKPVIALANVTKKEIPSVLHIANQLKEYTFMIAPHDPKDDSSEIINGIDEQIDQYSKSDRNGSRILILDTMGDLRYMYGYCDLAYVGGGFEKGPHNLLEPLVFGIPIICGPNIAKFPMAQYLKEEELLKIIDHPNNFLEAIEQTASDLDPRFSKLVEEFFKDYEDKLPALVNELLA